MNQNKNNEEQWLSWDFPFIFRRLWKNIFVILMCTVIVGSCIYVGCDYFLKDTYSVSMTLAVVGRDGSNKSYNDYNVNTAVTRNVSVLNSDMLKDQIRKSQEAAFITPDVTASRVGKSNLITLKASSDSAEKAFRLLKCVLNNYPTLSGYFESGYVLKNINRLSVEDIRLNQPRTLYYSLLAALLVFAAGIGLTVYICLTTSTIHNLDQASELLDIHMFGSLTFTKKQKGQKALLISDERTDISYMEEVDKLTTRIKDCMDEKGYRTLMISSMNENEGKSTVAANIAMNLARRGNRVLLIDVDMRRPALIKVFDKKMRDGLSLSDYFDGKATIKDITFTEEERFGIKIIFQKKAIKDPDRILNSDKFRWFIKTLGKSMNYVVIDSPPIGIVRDAELLSGAVDAAVLVVNQDKVKAPVINDIVDIMEDAGTDVIGGVLNMARGEFSSGRKSSHYGRYGKNSYHKTKAK